MAGKKLRTAIKTNSMIIIGAALLACGIFYVVNNPDIFMASVLSLQEKEFIAEKGRDIAYKTNSGYVDIFLAEKMDIPQNIDFTIIFDKDTITIHPENLSGQGTWKYEMPENGTIILQETPGQNIDKSQSLIMLPFTGNSQDILLSEAITEGKGLSIGSLNEITSHTR